MANSSKLSPFAGLLPEISDLIDVDELLRAYESSQPDPKILSHRVLFGTSGHRGSSLDFSFNKNHILAICQAVCSYRKKQNVTGPLFLGFDTHALSRPAFETALEVFAANEVNVMISESHEFTPTPVISHAILCYNRNRTDGLADGVVITPSHNPPSEGGIKYNPTHGGPAESDITNQIQREANQSLESKLFGVKQIPLERAYNAATTHTHDYQSRYIGDLKNIVDMKLIRDSKIKMGVDPLGGAGVHYWQHIADHYKIDLTVLNPNVDPQFGFMTRDWDGKIRMDPSSPYAMQSLIQKSKNFDISFACDTDHDRHGIVTKKNGLMPSNDYLCASIFYLFKNRPLWNQNLKVGKTIVSSQMIDRVARSMHRETYEVPVGFKYFVEKLLHGEVGFSGEESAGASFLRMNGEVWTTDKDAFVPSLLAAEMTAKLKEDPSEIYQGLTNKLGKPYYKRIDAPATLAQREKLKSLKASDIHFKSLAGESVENILTTAPGNNESFGGIKIETKNGWIAARPSGTEDIYKIYGESFLNPEHLEGLLSAAQATITKLL